MAGPWQLWRAWGRARRLRLLVAAGCASAGLLVCRPAPAGRALLLSPGQSLRCQSPSLTLPSGRQLRGRCTRRCQAGEGDGDEIKAAPSSLPLPLGPLCPVSSEFWAGLETDPYADVLQDKQKVLAGLMMKLQMGEKLEREEELTMCKEMKESNDMWRATNMRMRYAEDFQTVENYKFVEARLKREGMSMDMIEAIMVWQPQQMQAMFERRPPPPMPAGLDLGKVQQISQRMPSIMNSLSPAQTVKSLPMSDGSVLENDLVREELQAVMRDHEQIIRFGKGYRSFDPRGKEAFLKQLEIIQERWRVLMTRFQLMGQLNPDFVSEYEAYLKSVGLTIVEFNELLSATHELMRQEAEQEGLER